MKTITLFFFLITFSISRCFAGLNDYDLNTRLEMSQEELIFIQNILEKPIRDTRDVESLSRYKKTYNNNAFSTPFLASGYYRIEPVPMQHSVRKLNHPTLNAINEKWDIHEFSKVHYPIKVGDVLDRRSFSRIGIQRSMHLPVKFPNSEFRIPTDYQQMKEALQKIIDFEADINPDLSQYYAYLTVDQRFVPGGQAQRIQGAHVDGLPRDRKNPNSLEIDHSYLVSDSIPTKFYVHPFPEVARYDLQIHDFWKIFDYFKKENHTVFSRPFEIALMNAYTVHTAVESSQDVIRTFMRLEFSKLIFDRKGNSRNPYFEYEWEGRDCFFPKHLSLPGDLVNNLEKS